MDIQPEKSKIDRIEEKLDSLVMEKTKKQRKFNVPLKARVGAKKLRDNYAIIVKVNENRSVDFIKERIIDQTVMVDGVPRLAGGEYIFTYKNKPLIIIPNWSVKPFSASEDYQKSLTDGSNAAGYRLLMNRMQGDAIKLGKKLGGLGLSIGGLIIAAIIGYSLLSG